MVSVFFYCHNLSMDMEKLFEIMLNKDEIQDIPMEYVCRVAICVFDIINSGDCFYKED